MSVISLHCQHQLNLFRRQYLQLQTNVTVPDHQCLRQDAFQQALLQDVFSDDATEYQPPQRYQLRILKELMQRIEASITNWEDEVCKFLRQHLYRICLVSNDIFPISSSLPNS